MGGGYTGVAHLSGAGRGGHGGDCSLHEVCHHIKVVCKADGQREWVGGWKTSNLAARSVAPALSGAACAVHLRLSSATGCSSLGSNCCTPAAQVQADSAQKHVPILLPSSTHAPSATHCRPNAGGPCPTAHPPSVTLPEPSSRNTTATCASLLAASSPAAHAQALPARPASRRTARQPGQRARGLGVGSRTAARLRRARWQVEGTATGAALGGAAGRAGKTQSGQAAACSIAHCAPQAASRCATCSPAASTSKRVGRCQGWDSFSMACRAA